MKNQFNIRLAHWPMLTLVNLLIFIGCSKDKNEPEASTTQVETPTHLKDWQPQPKVDVKQPYMSLSAEKEGKQTLTLTPAADKDNKVWVDTNNNGVLDKEDITVTDPSKPITFTTKQKVYTVYGKVKELNASNNQLTAADARNNTALTQLNVSGNKLSEKALTTLVQHLPQTEKGKTAAVVLRNKDLGAKEGNKLTDAVLAEVKKKGWTPQAIQGGKAVADQGMAKPTDDKQAPKVGTITEAKATSFNTLSLKWSAATDNKTAQAKLRYQVLYQVKGQTEVKTSELKENMLSYTLTRLTEKTVYKVWVKVLDEANNAAEYAPKEVTTPAAPATADKEAPKVGVITEAKAVAHDKLFVKWTAATDNKTAQAKLRYQVLYQEKGKTEVQQAELKENMLSYALTGLTEKTTYVVKVKVLDEANNAAEYTPREVTTPAAPAAADKEAPKVGVITEAKATSFNTISLKWTAATDNKTAAAKLRYQVLYQVQGQKEVKHTELKENTLSYTLAGLTENTSYKVWVKVLDEANNAADYAAKDNLKTAAAPAPKPSAPYIQLTTEGTGTIGLVIGAAAENQKEVWIDLNGNGVWDEGPDKRVTEFGKVVAYPLKSKTIRVYGKIFDINLAGQQISALELHNPALEGLEAASNSLKSLSIPNSDALRLIDLSSNPELTSLTLGHLPNLEELYVAVTGLSTLKLASCKGLKSLAVDATPLTQLSVKENTQLKFVYITRGDGKGLIGKALEDFVDTLHSKGGAIYLSPEQKTQKVLDTLQQKGWDITNH